MAQFQSQTEWQRFCNIMNSRLPLTLAMDGEIAKLTIQGTPTKGFWNAKLEALVDIYNTNGTKTSVVAADWFKAAKKEAFLAEKAGDTDKAREIFNDLLNKSQLTFNVINRDGMAREFVGGEHIKAKLSVVDVADRDEQGVDLGTTHKSIVVDGTPVPQEALVIKKTALIDENEFAEA